MAQLSIIIPVYNAELYLSKCLDSILQQGYQDYEIICINDGSTDGSLLILEEYATKDDRIRIITQKNRGLIAARKAGLAVAEGNYTTFVDADDWIECDMYEVLVNKALEKDIEVVTSGCILEYCAGSIVEIEQMEEGVYEDEKLVNIFYPNMIGTDEFFVQNISLHVWNKIYKTDLIRRNVNKIPDTISIGEDAACVYPVLLEARRIAVVQKAFYHYRMSETSMMGRRQQYLTSYKFVYQYLKKRFMQYPYSFLDKQLKLLTIYELLLTSPQEFWQKQEGPFPYYGIGRGSRVVLYGMGRFGKLLKMQIEKSGWCQIVALMDQNKKINSDGERCYSIDEFGKADVEYDSILISILKRNICNGIVKKLVMNGVPAEKIREPDMRIIRKYKIDIFE